MLKGFEEEELGTFFDLLQRVRKATDDDDDLLTLMWEREFATLQYKYVDLTAEGGPGVESMERAEQKEKILSPAQAEAGLETTNSSIASLDDFDSTLYFLDDREVEYLQGEIKREFSTDLRPAVIASLLDIFETHKDPTVREEICGLLDYFLLILLSTAQYRNAAYLLREAGVTANRAPEILEPQKQRLTQLGELMSDPKASWPAAPGARRFAPPRSTDGAGRAIRNSPAPRARDDPFVDRAQQQSAAQDAARARGHAARVGATAPSSFV